MSEKTKETKPKKEENVEVMQKKKQDELEKLSAELEQTKSQMQSYLEMAQRITAEFDNYRKRNADLTKQSEENGIAKAVFEILPCIDAFDNAFKMVKDEGTLDGLELIYSNMFNALKNLGITEIEAEGKEFDPNLHNAVLATEDEKNAGKVLEVYQKGFIMGERVIRHSMVRVAK